jgi:hypothetical protein
LPRPAGRQSSSMLVLMNSASRTALGNRSRLRLLPAKLQACESLGDGPGAAQIRANRALPC